MNNAVSRAPLAPRKPLPVWVAWLAGALMSSLLFACVFLWGDMRFFNNDDMNLLRPLSGFCTQPPLTFNMCLNAVLVYPLRWLNALAPAVPWYSWMLLAFLWLSCTVIVKSLMSCFANRGRSPLWGALAGAAFLAVFAMTNCCVVTFTVVSAMLGAAAALQLMSVDAARATDGQVVRGAMASLCLLVLAYSLRQITAVPVLAFCGVAFLLLGVQRRRARLTPEGNPLPWRTSWRPLIVSALIVAVVMGGLAGLRELEIDKKGMRDYLRWQKARVSVMDYGGVGDLPEDILAQVGWSENELTLVDSWYFIDENISAEAFEQIDAYKRAQRGEGLGARLSAGFQEVLALGRDDPLAPRMMGVLSGVWLLVASLIALFHGRSLWRWLGLAGTALLCVGALWYLGVAGRLPLRAAMMVLLPTAALVFGLLPACLPKRGERTAARAALPALIACGCAALALWYALPAAQALQKPPASDEGEAVTNVFADLDEYALDNPDILFIHDATLSSDTRIFPAMENGAPTNVMFWGGWTARSPEYMAQLEAFAIDGAHADASIFLNDDVRLARATLDPPPDGLLAYLRETVDPSVEYDIDGEWGAVHTYQFYVSE